MVSEIQLDDAEIEAHLFTGAKNPESSSNRMTRKTIEFSIESQTIEYS